MECFKMLKFQKTSLRSFLGLLLASASLSSCACSDPRKPETNQSKKKDKEVAEAGLLTSSSKDIKIAVAQITPVKGQKASGTVTFTKVSDGIRVVAVIDGLTPGNHGFHVHEHGDCGGTAAAHAGGHFNPTKKNHGGPDSPERHVGDLGNILANEKGQGRYDRVDHLIAFEGENSIIGRSVIIHADADDFTTQPTGNSGPRIACGVVEATKQK